MMRPLSASSVIPWSSPAIASEFTRSRILLVLAIATLSASICSALLVILRDFCREAVSRFTDNHAASHSYMLYGSDFSNSSTSLIRLAMSDKILSLTYGIL
jgi:hypothetical protein